MLRLKYQLYEGVTPHDAITDAVGSIDPMTDLYLGDFADGDWLYGEIDADSGNQSTLESALTDWNASFFATDQAALDYVDGLVPEDTVLRTKLIANAATINGTTDRLEKTVTES